MSNCINPAAIREGDLLAYVDGVARKQVANHVEACASCAARVADLRSVQAKLTVSLQRAYCPTTDALGDLYLGLLPPGEKLGVAKHVRGCALCTRELREFAAPPSASGLLAAIGRLAPAVTAVLSAQLLPSREPASALRGTAARQQLYQAKDVAVLIGYRPETPQRGALSGAIIQPQQTPSVLCGIPVQLFRGEDLVAEETINELGHFHFAGVEPGRYDLTFNWREQMVLISEIRCGEP